jgi:hypothetical protein
VLEGEVISTASAGAKAWMRRSGSRSAIWEGAISATSGARTVPSARRNHCSATTTPWSRWVSSCGDLPYADKREHYLKENLLAQSLHESAYDHNPGFLRFAKERTLPFRAHAEFKKADLDARQQLYRRLADDLWSPTRLHRELASETGAA